MCARLMLRMFMMLTSRLVKSTRSLGQLVLQHLERTGARGPEVYLELGGGGGGGGASSSCPFLARNTSIFLARPSEKVRTCCKSACFHAIWLDQLEVRRWDRRAHGWGGAGCRAAHERV